MFSSLKQNITQAKPLHWSIWIVVLLLTALLAFAGNQWLIRYSPASEAFVEFNKLRLIKAGQSPNGAIVIIGDSHVKWGTMLPRQLEALLAQHGVNKKVVRITYDFASFNEFQPLMETIFAIKPSLIVMQNGLLSKFRTFQYHELIIRDYTKNYVKGVKPWNPGDADQREKQEKIVCSAMARGESIKNRIKRTAEKTYFKQNGPLHPKAQQFLTTAQNNNIPVILLSMPITTTAQQHLPKPFYHAQLIRPPANLISDNDFCDTVHLDISGREKFSPWLAAQIAQRLSETP